MNIFEFDACLVLESIIQLKKIYFKNVKLASKRIKNCKHAQVCAGAGAVAVTEGIFRFA
jgi:hypothetical protein